MLVPVLGTGLHVQYGSGPVMALPGLHRSCCYGRRFRYPDDDDDGGDSPVILGQALQ